MPSAIDNDQASLGLTEVVAPYGVFPSRGNGVADDPGGIPMGMIRIFAYNFAPNDAIPAQGGLLQISQNPALFSLVGTFYGGDGRTTFAVPDLEGRTLIGQGQGPGLTNFGVADTAGTDSVVLAKANLPVIRGGAGQAWSNLEPSLAATYLINVGGPLSSGLDILGEILPFASNFAPEGYLQAMGQLLPIAQFQALFQLIGTTYGGDGQTTFALPDLRGRAISGASAQSVVGTLAGQETATVTTTNLPVVDGGASAAIDNRAPSLTLNYLIALQGIYPIRGGGGGSLSFDTPYIGEIVAFAGFTAPNGWALAQGQLLQINQNTALFSLLGTMYGGNGTTTFALPDLRDRVVVGTGGTVSAGDVYGENNLFLSAANLPPLSTRRSDFSGDGKSDILWQNSNGTAAIWNMNGAAESSAAFAGANPGPTWHAVAAGDFNGDGKADIAWQNDDGTVTVWLMNGGTYLGGGAPAPNPGPNWVLGAAGDFNGDGKSDLAFQNSNTGQVSIWELNGTALIASGLPANPGTAWHIRGTGDFNGDGDSDILWQNDNGQVAIWLMNGTAIASAGNPGSNPGTAWRVAGAGDFTGDGKSDVLFQNSVTGQAAIWFINGTAMTGGGLAGSAPGTAWQIKGAGDYNGDGYADIIWQNSDGTPAVWLMNGTSFVSGGTPAANPGTSWHVIAAVNG